MKTVFCSTLILFSCLMLKAQVSLDTAGHRFVIKYNDVQRLVNAAGFVGPNQTGTIKNTVTDGVVLFKLASPGAIKPTEFAGVFFNEIPNLKQALTIWRYKPWNSWSKPVAITAATKMADWDVQFFYWQYNDGLYGAAVPLSGSGFRTTLGSAGDRWGSKAVSYAANQNITEVPGVAVAFGKDPFELFARVYRVALTAMGSGEDLVSKKTLPLPLQYIGWCTWNASDNGKNLNEQSVISGVKTFTDNHYPLGWVLIDDGWFQNKGSMLQSLLPDPAKFPNGFKPLVNKLKIDYGIKYVGVWHAFNGYWNGIDPESPLGLQYKGKLFSWNQRVHVESPDTSGKTYYFPKPDHDNIYNFYSSLHGYLKGEGFDFIKVDNQLSVEKMAVNNYPIDSLSANMHKALYRSVNKYFNGGIINCMDMTAEAYTNFGPSAVARAVEDFFPYQEGETYNLQHGNAAAHVVQATYNALYFSQMVYPDFDMFQSHNPNAVFHALARTLNNGPIYLTDAPGKQNFDILNKIVFADGRSIRSQTSLVPAQDCLFQVQQPLVFKAWSRAGNTGLLVLYNAADADSVSGSFKAADVNGLQGGQFALYEYFSGKLRLADANETFKVAIPRLGYQLQYVVPVINGFAPFGMVNKYNAPATITAQRRIDNNVEITLYEGGEFKAYCLKQPKTILVNDKPHPFLYRDQMVTVNILSSLKAPVVKVIW